MNYDLLKLYDWIDKDKIDWNWEWLSGNPNAIHILEQNVDKINYSGLSFNPNIFGRDYIKMSKIRTWIILEDLMKNALHPRRLVRFIKLGGDSDDF